MKEKDYGSTVPSHHMPLCDLALEGAVRNLPQKPGTQYWDKAAGGPVGLPDETPPAKAE